MNKKHALSRLLLVLAALAVFFVALSNLDRGRQAEGRDQLEAALRRAAVACYAAEGVYPPDLAYLQHYGIQVDGGRYHVVYEPIAANLMPEITVLDRGT